VVRAYTSPCREKRVVEHLDMRQIESFLPLYRSPRKWKNGCCVELERPLFPRSVSEYSEIVFQKHNGLCSTWNQATTCSTKSDYSDTLLAMYLCGSSPRRGRASCKCRTSFQS
jgi:hypothetical protein